MRRLGRVGDDFLQRCSSEAELTNKEIKDMLATLAWRNEELHEENDAKDQSTIGKV